MTQRIFKYPIHVADSQAVDMPEGAQILTIQVQLGQPCIWALVDDDVPPERREIHMRGTGHDCNGVERLRYVSTFQMAEGALIFHAFELPRSA